MKGSRITRKKKINGEWVEVKGSYVLRVFIGWTEDGKRIEKSKRFKGSETEADIELRKMLDEFQTHGEHCPKPSKQNLHDFLVWWNERTATEVRERTAFNRLKIINTYFPSDPAKIRDFNVTGLGRLPLGKVRPHLIDEHLASLRRPDEKNGKPRMNHASMKKIFGILRQGLRYATRKRLIPVNPTSSDLIDVPRAPKASKAQALTVEQAQTFLRFAVLERFRALWFTAIFLGCRPGELLGLEWKHVDLQKAEIRIEQSLYRPKGGGWKLTPPKTPKSKRTIPIPPEVVDELLQHKRQQDQERLAWSEGVNTDFVFTAFNGSPLVSNHLTVHNLQPMAKKAGLPAGLNLYSLRHTAATIMLHSGTDARVVADRLGHSDVRQVLETYYHPVQEAQRDATSKMGALLLGGKRLRAVG